MYDSQPQLSKESNVLYRQILKTEKKSFQLNHIEVHIEVHRQTGSNDCRLLTIANAVTLCIGADSHSTSYNQDKIRSHVEQCFQKQHMTLFPSSGTPQPKKQKRILYSKTVKVYCTCRLPWSKFDLGLGPMVQCQHCKEWFHKFCMDIPENVFDSPAMKYNCKLCANL